MDSKSEKPLIYRVPIQWNGPTRGDQPKAGEFAKVGIHIRARLCQTLPRRRCRPPSERRR